jgi:poly(3-hydroxybutyrate) depolymerase
MRRALVLLSGFLVAGAALSATKVTRETISLGGVQRTYYQAVPGEIQPGESLPLVLAFHGSGRHGDSIVEPWAKLAKKERIIVIGLDSVDSEQWQLTVDGPDRVHELVEALRRKLPIDPSRMYLFGHSAGAVYALRLALLESEYFAAVAVHAGSFRTDSDFRTIEMAKRKVPVFIIVGDRDQFFPLPTVEATVDALKRAGLPAEAKIMKGHDHWYYTLATSINARAWEFLRQQRLASEPRYEAYSFR